mgnify:CR=1 FL=1
MKASRTHQLPDPDRDMVQAWLARMNLEYVHENGWQEVNHRMHDLVMGARQFGHEQFPDDPVRREDFLDGVAFGLLGMTHASDIHEVTDILMCETKGENTEVPSKSSAAND